MDSARGLYSRLSGYNADQDLDDELDSLLSLPNVNPNQPREWLHIDGHGKTSYALVDKHAVVAELGIRYRDLRILDPLVPTPYPTALFIRDKALVVNLESIRMIVSADQVFVLSAPEPGQSLVVGKFPEPSNPFIRDLIARLTTTQSTSSRGASSIDRTLPFELRALEAALAHTCRSLEQESIQVERATLPALKSLMQKVSRQELDKVRSCKSNLNKMLARVLELKQELEGMLDDDQDMADMYLGRRQDADNTKEEEKARRAIEPPSPTASAVSMDSIEAADFMGQSESDTEVPARPNRPASPGDANFIRKSTPIQAQPPPQAMDTPFGASDQQQDGSEGAAVERFSTIDEAAEDIADNWGKAPQPRRDATRHRDEEPGMGSHRSSSSLKVATSAPPMETPLLVSPPNRDASLSAAPSAPPTQFANTKNGKHHRGHKHEESKGKWRNKVKKISELLTVMDKMQAPGGLPFVNAQDISACEDLLEAYFMQVDFLLSRLKVLYERIDDTEDLINIELDHRRNELVALDLVITAVSTMFAFVAMIGGIFGMNMKNGYEESHGKMEGLQRQQAQLAILEAALASSKNDNQKSLNKVALLEEQLADRQDDLHAQKAQLEQQQTQAGSMQAAMATLQRQLEAASASHNSTQQQLHSSQAEIIDCKQQLADAQALLTSNEANLQSSSQSIVALQEGISQQVAVVTASEGKYQALLAEMDFKDEQLKQMAGKLRAAEHAAVSAQDAAHRLQTRLTSQQAEASDQSQELTDALEVGSNTVHQLEVTIQVLQEKLFAAENAMKSQREQLHSQKASACDSIKHAEQLAQQLTDKTGLITSLQAALDTATFVADSNQHLVSSLQETHSSREADAGEQVTCLVAQLQLQATKNGELLAELASVKGKLSLADQAIAAAVDRTQASQQEQSQLGAKVTHLSQLLSSRERREWLAKTHAADIEVSPNPGVSAAAGTAVQGVVSSPPSSSLRSPKIAHKLALLTLAPKSAGSLRASITSVAGQRPTNTPLSEILNLRKASSHNKGAVLQTSTSVYADGVDAKENNSVPQMS